MSSRSAVVIQSGTRGPILCVGPSRRSVFRQWSRPRLRLFHGKISFGTPSKGPDTVEVAKIPTETTDQAKSIAEANEADSSVQEGSGDEVDVADATDAGSGDTDEMAADAAPKVSAAQQAQLAKQAKARAEAEELARKTADAETSTSSHVAVVAPVSNGSDHGGFREAPLLLRRDSMPLLARLTASMLEVPQGFIPAQIAKNTTTANERVESAAVAKAEAAKAEAQALKSAAQAAKGEPVANNTATAAAGPGGDEVKVAATNQKASDPKKTGLEASTPSGDSETSGDTSSSLAGATQAGAAVASKTGKPQGFVYRAFMTLDDLDTLGPKITQLVQELGGVKAGEVELGWKKGNSVRYYHFSIPDDNQEKLVEQLQTYGPVRISKDPHPRIMPKGQVRFILWVEAPKSTH